MQCVQGRGQPMQQPIRPPCACVWDMARWRVSGQLQIRVKGIKIRDQVAVGEQFWEEEERSQKSVIRKVGGSNNQRRRE